MAQKKSKKYHLQKLDKTFTALANDYIELNTERAIPRLRAFIDNIKIIRTGNLSTKAYSFKIELDYKNILGF